MYSSMDVCCLPGTLVNILMDVYGRDLDFTFYLKKFLLG
uniref:Uncharacterized protein n=1 Tax=Arundo donax TaxID=35708 RepID=A0A0A9GPM2_ARUDO